MSDDTNKVLNIIGENPKIIPAYKIEIIRINSLENLCAENILEINHGKPELIVDVRGRGVNEDKWPTEIYNVSRGVSKTESPTIIRKLYSPLSNVFKGVEELGINSLFQEGVYLRNRLGDQDDEGWLISLSEGARNYDKRLKKVGL